MIVKRKIASRDLKMWYSVVLKYVSAFLIPAIFAILICHQLDNDSWGLLAEGRYIVEHGLYSTDVLSIHSMPIVVSNYAFAVVFWYVYSMFGAVGIYICMLLLNFVVCFLLYKICSLFSENNVGLSLTIMMGVDCLLILVGFVVTRAQMLTFVLMLSLIYLLELYVASGRVKYLLWLPFISLIQINFHASYWWILIVIMMVFIIDSFKSSFVILQGYRTKPLLMILLAMIVAGLINPYGIQMIVSIFGFYFNGVLNNMVQELQAYSPFMDVWTMIIFFAITIVSYLYLHGDRNGFRMRYFLMYFGFLALALNTVKAFSQFILVMGLPLALMYRDVSIGRVIDSVKVRRVMEECMGGLALVVFMVVLIWVLGNFPQTPRVALVKAVDAIENDLADADKDGISVYAGYNDGGYIEYRGFKAYLDPRGDPDITKEWQDFMNGRIGVDEMLEKYKFDYLITEGDNDPFYEMNNDKCEVIYENDGFEKVFSCDRLIK